MSWRTADDAWAVGYTYRGVWLHRTALEPLIEHWDGRRWAVTSSPRVSGSFSDISVVSSRDAWAVGEQGAGSRALIAHWNGQRWQRVPSPGIAVSLTAVAVVSSHDVWAVGDSATVAHWDGARWAMVTSRRGGYLADVVAASPHDVWAVGNLNDHLLAEHWDGARWRVFVGPARGVYSYFSGVSAVSANDVWAIGNSDPGIDTPATFDPYLYHWDGKTWTAKRPPPTSGEELNALTVLPGDEILIAAQDRGAYIYNAVGSELLRRHQETWQTTPGAGRRAIWALATDQNGEIWGVGSIGSGFGIDDFPARTRPLVERIRC